MDEVLKQLTPDQAVEVVRRLYERDEGIREALLREARIVLEAVDLGEVADEVFFVLDSLAVQDLWDRSGSKREGYASPDEAVADMMEEELEPFFEQVRKYLHLDMLDQAQTYCMGVLLGIYRFDLESASEFKQWAGDMPQECFGYLLDEWKKNGRSTMG